MSVSVHCNVTETVGGDNVNRVKKEFFVGNRGEMVCLCAVMGNT